MYIPKYYPATDQEEIIQFIKTHHFASTITVKDNFQQAPHLPFVITETENEIILTSHFANANL